MRQKIIKILKTAVASAAAGVFIALIVCAYKFCAHHIIHLSEKGFFLVRENLWLLPIVLALLFLIAFVLCKVYSRYKNLKGGGIPNAILAAKGKLRLSPVCDTVGIFLLSLVSFFLGVPLGNEGPCVQMGAALSGGISKVFSKDEEFGRTQIAAGACAGFAAATGAPLSGVAFCVDEISHRPKALMLLNAAVSSIICAIVMHIVCPLLGVEAALLPRLDLPEFSIKDIWIAVFIGLVFSIIAVCFLKLYKLLGFLYNKLLGRVPMQYKIFFVLALTLAAGLSSSAFISTGHSLSIELFSADKASVTLLVILLVRSFLTLSANANGLSGGTFVPLIAIGAVAASALGAVAAGALGAEYYQLVMVLSITACIAGMMKMPITAVFFALETLCSVKYVLYVVIAAAAAYLPVLLFKAKSINEAVLEKKFPETSH